MEDNKMLQLIYDELCGVKGEVSGIKEEISGMKEEISEIKEDISDMKEEISEMKEDISNMKEDISNMKEDISNLQEDVSGIKKDVSNLEDRVQDIQLTLENETNRNIRIVAEGHIDLSRKLTDALKVADDDEMLRIRVNIMENEIRRLKQERGFPI